MTTQTTIPTTTSLQWRKPVILLILLVIAMRISHDTWFALLNNFAVHKADFTGKEIGILQSIREIPGFLAFGVVFVLLIIREQMLAFVSLIFLGVGVAITGYFPDQLSFYATTVLMSIGFHYYETVAQSLALQWVDKKNAAHQLGRIMSAASFAAIAAYCIIFVPDIIKWMNADIGTSWFSFKYNADYPFEYIYLIAGLITILMVIFCFFSFPMFPQKVEQNKQFILRKRYWLYYALTFLSGARRQIFIVFAAFMMVQKFGYSVAAMTTLLLVNHMINMIVAPQIGRLIGYIGERRMLTVEYIGLIIVFTSYAFVTNHYVAAGLYIVDHFFFAMAIAMKTYFQKIADPADIAPTASVAFSINHIAAVFLPVLLGLLWLHNPSAVFLIGAVIACGSLVLSRFIPLNPTQDVEFIWKEKA
ncbi:MAG: MFS transporter [Methyloligellaceae bacterium]